MAWLYRYECKGIQSWILAGGKLRDIVAASDLIEDIGSRRSDLGCAGTVVNEAAGGATLTFEKREHLERFASLWPMHMDAYAPGLQVVQAWVPLSQDGGDDWRHDWSELQKQLAMARQRLFPDLPQAGPLVEIAGRTGEPAWAVLRGTSDQGQLLDRAGVRKSGSQSRRAALAERFRPEGGHWEFAQDDKDMDGQVVAVVHADGNRIGEWIQGNPLSHEGFRRFSDGLTAANQAAVQSATRSLADHVAGGSDVRRLPMRPVVLGGDDVTIVINAKHAVPWVAAYLQAFEAETKDRLGEMTQNKGFTACAGIAFCKLHWPFVQALEVAESLCRAAKVAGRKADKTQSTVQWHRILGTTETDWEVLKETELAGGRLVGGPWTIKGLERLAKLSRVLEERDVPKGAIRRWIDEFGPRDNTMAAKDLWERTSIVTASRPKSPWPDFQEALESCGASAENGCFDDRNATPLYDALTWARMQHSPGLWTPAKVTQ